MPSSEQVALNHRDRIGKAIASGGSYFPVHLTMTELQYIHRLAL